MTSAADDDLAARLAALYPALAELPPSVLGGVIEAHAHFTEVPSGTMLFDEGSPCQGFPMVLSGAVRVARGSPGGRMLELYRVTPGELCVVSTACLFGQTPLSAHGQAVEATELVLLQPQGLDAWCQHAAFRRFVFGVFGDRLADLMALAEAVAFQRLDQRLAQALLGHGSSLQTTHQALADNLGTVREIVSRLLNRFERAGWVQLSRERIDVLDGAALRMLAAGQGGLPGG
jgi:CRP/FNR family transcriptional regulator, anaerobic regulatory protein